MDGLRTIASGKENKMTQRKPPENSSEFLDGLVELFTNLPERTTKEIEEDLREEGIDTELSVRQTQELVRQKLEEQRLGWLERARQKRSADLERLSSVQPSRTIATLGELKQKVQSILSGQFGPGASEYAHAHLHYRSLDDVPENDLRTLIDDLERFKLLIQPSDNDEGPGVNG